MVSKYSSNFKKIKQAQKNFNSKNLGRNDVDGDVLCEKYKRELSVPDNKFDVRNHYSKNSQEIQYMSKIASKNLMSPDLKLADINKNIEFARSTQRKLSKNRLKAKKSNPDRLP